MEIDSDGFEGTEKNESIQHIYSKQTNAILNLGQMIKTCEFGNKKWLLFRAAILKKINDSIYGSTSVKSICQKGKTVPE